MPTLLTGVRGIGPAAAKNLSNHGITSVEELASVSVSRLCQVPGYSTVLSQRIIADARALLAQGGQGSLEICDNSDVGQSVVTAAAKPGPAGEATGKVMATKNKEEKKGSKKKRKTSKQESKMSKKSEKKVKTLKKEIKSRKSKISKQDKKIKRLKKALKKVS